MASGTFWTQERPETPVEVAQVAARDVLLIFIGWTAGGVVLSSFSTRPISDPLAVGLLTVSIALAVPLGVLAVMRRGVTWLRRDRGEETTSIVPYIIGYSAAQAVIWAVWPYLNEWTPMQLWSAVGLWFVLVTIGQAALRIVHPGRFAGIRGGRSRLESSAVLASVMSIFLFAWVLADGFVQGAREPCDPLRFYCLDASSEMWQRAAGPAWFGGWSAVTLAAFALRLRFIAVAAVAMAGFGYGFWAQQVSKEIDLGATVIAQPWTLVAMQLVGVLALLGAAGVILIYEQPERTPEELRVLSWFGGTRPSTHTPND